MGRPRRSAKISPTLKRLGSPTKKLSEAPITAAARIVMVPGIELPAYNSAAPRGTSSRNALTTLGSKCVPACESM